MAQYPGVPWNLRPDYVALTRRVDPAGLVTAYNPPRPGVSNTDVTSFVFGQATITMNNWPEVMYYLNPTPDWIAFRGTARPPQRQNAQGQGMVEQFPRVGEAPRALLDYPILPDTINSQEELWWIELWRRMDPRIQWQDIIMRIERPNPTRNSDIRLQNSSNNLINRQMNMRYSMLAWHSTGINGMRANHVRTEVLARVHAANPPLPPNSTRGLTPGLINPLLGNVPGNLIPFPPLGNSQGRLRASGRPQATQAAAAAAPQALANTAQSNAAQANPPQPNQVQATLTQNNPGRNSRGHVRRIPRKRNHTSPDTNSRPLKRQSLGFNNDDMDDNMNDNMDEDMDAPSDGHESSEDIPLSVTKARADTAKSRKSSKGTPAIGGMAKAKARDGAIKKKPSSKKAAAAKKTKKSARRQQRDSTLESEPDHDEDENEERGSPGPQLFLEGDPGFEAAFQASRRARPSQQAQGTARRPQVPPPREAPRAPRTSTARNFSQDDVSDLELLGDNEGSTLVAPTQRADTATTPRVIAPPPQIIDRPSPVRHQRISAITGLAFAGPRRRPEALGGYGDSHTRRRGSPVRNSRVAASTGVSIAEADSGRGVVAGNSYAARLGLPVAQPNRPPQDVYVRAPDGSHHHYTDDSGVPTYVTHPDPSTTSHVGYTSNQRRQGHTQTNAPAQPVHPSQNPQPTSQNPADAPNDQRNLVATNRRTTRVAEATASHHNAIIEEMRRRQSWPLEQIGRLNREIMDAMRDDDDDFASGFLEREMERERRERQHSSEEDDD